MHNISHIERFYKSAQKLVALYPPEMVDMELVKYGCYFHGMIHVAEQEIKNYLINNGIRQERIERILEVSIESHANEIPETFEGKLLHDAHLIEGGKTFLIVKSLCTGSARGQTIEETIKIIEERILGKRKCYLPEAISIHEEMEQFSREFLNDLKLGLS